MEDIKTYVKERYGAVAEAKGSSCCSSGCGCGCGVSEQAMALGYTMEELAHVPEDAFMGLGCGNPTALADLKEGETVLDLGSGGGIDVFLGERVAPEKVPVKAEVR